MGRPVGVGCDDAALHAALLADQLLEAPAEEPEDEQDAKKEVLNHLENFTSLRDSDFLPPGAFYKDVLLCRT